MTIQTFPIALTIAGSDSGGGAGIQADLKTFSALGVYGSSVITAITAQNTCEVRSIHSVPIDIIEDQIRCVLEDLSIAAIKIGMMGDEATITAIAQCLSNTTQIPIVLDPVMVSKTGKMLLASDATQALMHQLIPQTTLITPNLPEAAVLCQKSEAQSLDDMYTTLDQLMGLGSQAVLLKGGHLASSDRCFDLLGTPSGIHRFESTRIKTQNTHGTGCSMASAITANLAKGFPLEQAVESAKNWLTQAIEQANRLNVGRGFGPVHHFHNLWL
ncbi:bifunctional hydroxymethylpyrimidine kinase/phosphomethylpyrimidine kinase [Nitrincola alkalisediminis]|uniref:bifunctional hydroxymethylpyrimidine kinase/phosphomethylpyrimidine kinase n=1 Tax=Nitrincola alkalisediminis TaxID=1366656 RepID=UPI001875B8E5|nr:bifunctional hydroxymethylpyrimidine kinase/phosphomethylpyrimidine kinase [Nitrincola alkalisediminis]